MPLRSIGKTASTYGDRNIPLRRPHESTSSNNVCPQTLIKKLESIQCEKGEDEVLEKCIEIFEMLTPTEDDTVNVIRHLHTACLIDGSISRPTASFLAKLIKRKGESGHFIRTQWLLLLQEDYEGRITLSTSAHETFLNAVLSHGEMYNALHIASVPLKVLVPPLLQYLRMILISGAKEDLLVLLLQILVNGGNLKEQGGNEYEELKVEIRKVLLKSSFPQLLLALDIVAGIFPHPKGPLRDFYETELKEDYLFLESRFLRVPFVPNPGSRSPVQTSKKNFAEKVDDPSLKNESPSSLETNDSSWKKPVPGSLPDVNVVRERMRAKGLLPRLPGATKQLDDNGVTKEKDDDFYGVQIPRAKQTETKTKSIQQAMSAPLPGNDDWD